MKSPRTSITSRYSVAFILCLSCLMILMASAISVSPNSSLGPASLASSARAEASEAPAASSPFAPSMASPALLTPLAPILTATKTDNRPSIDPATANPGDTIMYTVVISNSGTADATNVNFTDTIDANTTLVAGSFKASPIALNDTYNTIGNVPISIAAPGVRGNDLNPNVVPSTNIAALTVTKVNATVVPGGGMATAATTHGSVTMHSDGSFDYSPTAGFPGPTDTFTYTLDNGTGKTDTATVTINISGLIWFVDDTAGPAGDGRLGTPFRNLVGGVNPLTGTVANDVIFIYTGTSNYADTGTLTLTSGEKVIGQGATQSILIITGFTAPSGPNTLPATGGTNPVITGSNITAITLGSNNGLHGITIGDTGASGTDLSGSNFGNLTVNKVSLTGTGEAMNLFNGTIVSGATFGTVESNGGSAAQGMQLSQVGGGFTITTTNMVNPTGNGIDVQNSPSGSAFNFGSTTVNKNSTAGIGVKLASNIGTFSFSSLTVTTNNGTGVEVSSSGTVNVTTGSISATGGPALDVDPTALGMTFTTVSSTNSASTGITLTSVSGSLSITTTTITNPTGIGINEISSSATVNYGDATVNGSGNTGVVLGGSGVGNTGTITFGALNIAPDNNKRGLLAQENTNTITTTSGTISTVGSPAASGLPAIEITRSSATTPLAISLTTVSANGATSGIVMTRTSGSFTIVGTGTANSGGVIQNTTTHGVALTTVQNITFNRFSIHDTADHGIFGDGVDNFTFRDSTIFNFGNASASGPAGPDEDGMHFESTNSANTAAGHGLTGNVIIQRDTIGPDGHFVLSTNPPTPQNKGIVVRNHNDVNLNMTVTGTTFFQVSDDGIDAEITDGTGTLNVDGSTADGANVFNQINGRAVNFQNPVDNAAARVFELTIKNNTFTSVGIGGRWLAAGRGTMNARYTNNTMTSTSNDAVRSIADAVNSTLTPHATTNATITNNTFGGGSAFIAHHRQAVGNIAFNNNTGIGPVGGIFVSAEIASTVGIDILSNSGTVSGNAGLNALYIQAANNGVGASTICANISGNTLSENPNNTGFQSTVVLDTVNGAGDINLENWNGSSPTYDVFISNQNTLSGGTPNVIADVPAHIHAGGNCVTSTPMSNPDVVQAASSVGQPQSDSTGQKAPEDVLLAFNRLPKGDSSLAHLSQGELNWMIQAAIERWRETGISAEDLARLQQATLVVSDLPEGQIATALAGKITIDETAGGYGWYYDQRPQDDSEFDVPVPNRELQATEYSPAYGKLDLLTVVMRELGTVYVQGKNRIPKRLRPLMEITLSPGVRRLPDPALAQILPPQPEVQSAPQTAPAGTGTASKSSSSSSTGNQTGTVQTASKVVAQSGEMISQALGTLPIGKSVTLMFSVTINDPVTPNTIQVCNQGHVTADGGINISTDDPDTGAANDSTCTPLNVADIAVTKTDSPDPVQAGNNITYTVTLTNNGPAVANAVTLSDPIPANTTFVSTTTPVGWTRNDSTAVGATGTLMFSKATMANAEAATFTIVVNVNSGTSSGTTISNTATGATTSPNPTANDAATATTTVNTSADLEVTKTDSPDPVDAGSNITYTINFTNHGPSDAQSVTVTDAVPANTTFVSAVVTTGSGWSTSAPSVGGTGNVVFSKTPVLAGETAVFTIVVNVNATAAHNSTITNNAVGASTTTDPNSANNTGTATTTVHALADVAVTKSNSPDPVLAGNNLTYTINFVNNGPTTAGNVTVTDATPANTTFVSATVTTGTGWSTSAPSVGGTGNVVFSKAAVANGETAVFTIVVKVNSNTASGTVITNSATAASTNSDPDPSNNTATAMATVNTQADIQMLNKNDSPDPVNAGAQLTYTIAFRNPGPSDAQNVVITDVLPAGTTFVSLAGVGGPFTSSMTPPVGTNGTVTISAPSVPADPNTSYNFILVVKVDSSTASGTIITNTVSSTTTTTDPDSTNNSKTATTNVTTSADLAVTKSDSPDPVTAGNNLTYTINFVNNGPSDAQTVTVTDAVPANTTFVSAMVTAGTGWGMTAPSVGGTGNVVFSKGTVVSGETAVFQMVVKVSATTASGATISNSAVGASATTDPNSANNTGSASTTVQASADLAVTKSDSPDPVAAGANITYTINFVNNGPSDAQTVTLTDATPANTTFVSAVVTTGSGWSTSAPTVGNTGNVVFSKSTVAAGETAVFTVVVKVNSNTAAGTTITNNAVAASATTDPTPGNNTGTATTSVQAQADLAVTKSDSPDPVTAGSNLTYTLIFTNNGPSDASTVTVTDAVPANTTFVSAVVTIGSGWSTVAPSVGNTGNVVFSKATVANGETAVFTIVVKVNANTADGSTITNSAVVAGATIDPDSSNNTGTATTTVQTRADLAVTKSDSPDPVTAGNNLTYTINFVNNGPSDAQSVTVTDAVPAGTTFVSSTVTTGSGWGSTTPLPGGTGNVVFSKSTVAAGETAVFTIVVKVNSSAASGSTITNSATAATATVDPTSGNNTGTATTTVQTSADLAVTKSDSPDPVTAGANLTYTINFVNNGPSDAQSVTVTDAVPANTTFVSATVTTGTGWSTNTSGPIVFSKSSVAAGETAVFTMVVKVNSNTTTGTTISNSATAASTTSDPTPGNNTGSATTTVQVSADLAVTKSDSPDPVIASQNLTYTINFSNNGPSDAQTVTVTDAIPANTTFVSATVTTGSGWSVSAPAVGASSGNIVFSKATVAGGETAVFTIVVNVGVNTPNNTIITNSATAATTTTDPNSSNNTGTAMTTVLAQADLAVTKSDSPDPVCVNGNITYTINFVDNGPGPGINTTVTDAVPANTTFVSASVTSGTGWSISAPAVGNTGNVVFSKSSTASGETAIFQIVVKVNSGTLHDTVITNMATAASSIPDQAPGNNTGTTTTTVDPIPPTFTNCPPVTVAGQPSCPFSTSTLVNFATPVATDNCSGVTVVCNPPSGSMFPVGTTSVTCTATDAASNTAQCSFAVNVFSFCLQDDSSPGNVVFVNATTGDYLFCSGGVQIASGRGTLTVRGCQFGIEQIKGDRKVIIGGDTSANNGLGAGNAVIQKANGHMVIQITDRNLTNNTCQCSPSPPQSIPREKPDPGKRINGN